MSDGYLRLNEVTASESIGRWYRSRPVAWTSIGGSRAGLCSTSPASYHRPACDPPSTWSTSPLTWPAFARYRTASVTSFTCAIFPIGCNVRRNSFGSFSCMGVSTIPGATALNLIPSLCVLNRQAFDHRVQSSLGDHRDRRVHARDRLIGERRGDTHHSAGSLFEHLLHRELRDVQETQEIG